MVTIRIVGMPGAIVANGDRVTLRTTEHEDLAFLSRQNNPDLRLPTGNPIFHRAGIEDWADEGFGDHTPLIVCLDDDGVGSGPVDGDNVQRVGSVALEDHGHSRPEVAYWLLPEYQGKGYGKEAVGLAVDIAFQEHHHPAVEAKTFPDNDASRGLLESLGFTQEGHFRNYTYWDGRYRDFIVYGLLREEWQDQD